MSLWDDYMADLQFEHDFPYGVDYNYWTTRDGIRIKLCDMSEEHIRNCMRMVGEDDDWYYKFEEELNRRASKDVAIDDDFDFNAAMASLYPYTEYVINKFAYDSGVEGVKEKIVRCKDCEYLEEDDSKWRCSNLEFYIDFVCGEKPDGFCKWGERKEK